MKLTEVALNHQRLRELREGKRLTLQDVAVKVGVKRGTIHNYEKGNASPSADILARLCILYGVSIQEITNAKNFANFVS
jgi:transcriptional regulator with XRE-family HTH domain